MYCAHHALDGIRTTRSCASPRGTPRTPFVAFLWLTDTHRQQPDNEGNMMTKKFLDSSIDCLKKMLADHNNELGSGERRALRKALHKLKKLKLEPKVSREEVSRVVSEVALIVFEIM